MTKKGRIKYSDPDKGYGYIVADDAKDATETIVFHADDDTIEFESFVSGTTVEFDLDQTDGAPSARNIRMAD